MKSTFIASHNQPHKHTQRIMQLIIRKHLGNDIGWESNQLQLKLAVN